MQGQTPNTEKVSLKTPLLVQPTGELSSLDFGLSVPRFGQISQFCAATDKIYYNTSSQKCSSDLHIKTMIYTLLETLKKTNFRESKKKLRKLWKGL